MTPLPSTDAACAPDRSARRHWGAVADALVPQLCGLAEALGRDPSSKQSEALCQLLSCLCLLAGCGLADEAVRAGGGRLLSITATAFLVSSWACVLAACLSHPKIDFLWAPVAGSLGVTGATCAASAKCRPHFSSHRCSSPQYCSPPLGLSPVACRRRTQIARASCQTSCCTCSREPRVPSFPQLLLALNGSSRPAAAGRIGACSCLLDATHSAQAHNNHAPPRSWCLHTRRVAKQHPSLWVALVSGGTIAQLLGWAADHLQARHRALGVWAAWAVGISTPPEAFRRSEPQQGCLQHSLAPGHHLLIPPCHSSLLQKPLAWDLLVIAALVAECCSQLDALTGSATLPVLAAVWQGTGAPPQAGGSGGRGRSGGRGGRGGRSSGRGAGTAGREAALPTAADGQRLHSELDGEVRSLMKGLKRTASVFIGELNAVIDPPEVRAGPGWRGAWRGCVSFGGWGQDPKCQMSWTPRSLVRLCR